MSVSPSLVVGIGASAGGLKPIEDFFIHMPPDTGMAFVIVQHLSPDFKSLMDELLQRHTSMPIHRVTDGISLEENSIYLIPPKKNMSVSGNQLMLCDQIRTGGPNLPIDRFFDSLAAQMGVSSVAIVLSGSGSDGSRGLQAVHDLGGLVMVQSPESSGFDSMPRAAITTGKVDIICDPGEMPLRLLEYASHRNRDLLSISTDVHPTDSTLSRLCRFYKARNAIDFSYYKPGTIRRRLDRRVQLSTVASLDEYMQRVETNDDEANLLFRDLLVEVTHFFRDPEAFAELREEVIPDLIRRSNGDEEFRAWVCGCATGEEAYSIAMSIHECMENAGEHKKPFKVFATDIHPASIEFAGEGTYSRASLENLPKHFQDRYFMEVDGGFKVKQEIRQRIIFAINDATKDAPFTRLNLVSCRNMLIYLLPPVQKRILSIFHFGLKNKGVLFLGPSETVGDLINEFEEVDRHWRIFRKRRDVRLVDSGRLPFVSDPAEQATSMVPNSGSTLRQFRQQSLASSVLSSLLNRYLPASLLLDEYNELVHCIGDARKLLTFPEGQPTKNVLHLLSKELNAPVSAALHRCRKNSETVTFKGVRIQLPGESLKLYQLRVESLEVRSEPLYLVSFLEMTELPPAQTESVEIEPLENAEEQIDQLKLELNYTRETLQATVEELESSNEELQATNEELIASNEELQSTNEELQSTNEELHTVNQENRLRIDQLNEVTEDLELLLSRTATGILFLDEELHIRKFTRSITQYFDLQPGDIGRSIDNFTHRTGIKNFYQQLREAVTTGSEFAIESAVSDEEKLIVELAVRRENPSGGVMLTIGQKTSQGFGIASKQFYLPIGAGFWQWPDVTKDEMWWSPRCFDLLGFDQNSVNSKFSNWRDLVHPDDVHRLDNAGTDQCIFVQKGFLVLRMRCANGEHHKFEYRAAIVLDENEKPKSMMGSFAPFQERTDEESQAGIPGPKLLTSQERKVVS